MSFVTVLEVFGAALAAIITALGGWESIKGWHQRKESKRKASAEASTMEVGAEKALRDMYEESLRDLRTEHTERTKELRSTIADVNLMYHTAIKDSARKDEIIDDKTAKIREQVETISKLQGRLIDHANYEAALKLKIAHLEQWHCEREQPRPDMTEEELAQSCGRREPPQKVPVRYERFKIQTIEPKEECICEESEEE